MDHIAVFEEQVALTPKDLRAEIKSIDSLLEEKLRGRLEGRCSRHGYVLQNTIKVLSRSMGMVERGRFTGNVIYHVQAEGGVLNPPDGAVIEGEVIRKNKMGLYVNYRDAIRVIVPRDVNIGNDEFESVEVGEMVKVEIKKSRFQVNDEYVLSVGLFRGLAKTAVARRKVNTAPIGEEVAEEELDEEEADAAEEEGEEEGDEAEEEGDEEEGDEEEDAEAAEEEDEDADDEDAEDDEEEAEGKETD